MSLWESNIEFMGLLIFDIIVLCLIGGFFINLWETMLDFWNWVFWKLKPKKEQNDGELTISAGNFEVIK